MLNIPRPITLQHQDQYFKLQLQNILQTLRNQKIALDRYYQNVVTSCQKVIADKDTRISLLEADIQKQRVKSNTLQKQNHNLLNIIELLRKEYQCIRDLHYSKCQKKQVILKDQPLKQILTEKSIHSGITEIGIKEGKLILNKQFEFQMEKPKRVDINAYFQEIKNLTCHSQKNLQLKSESKMTEQTNEGEQNIKSPSSFLSSKRLAKTKSTVAFNIDERYRSEKAVRW